MADGEELSKFLHHLYEYYTNVFHVPFNDTF